MSKIDRLIDANHNRLKEGLRVLEDIARYIYDHKDFSAKIKSLRHSLQKVYSIERVKSRDILADVSKATTESEIKRGDLTDLIIANFSRAEESSRVLEEAFKLTEPKHSGVFKSIRYELYDLEKRFLEVATTNSTSNSK